MCREAMSLSIRGGRRMTEEIKDGDYVAVVCKVLEANCGVYPNMHAVLSITDDEAEFMACNKAIIGKVDFSQELGWHIQSSPTTARKQE